MMYKKKILIISDAFPFGMGEQFLQKELFYWSKDTRFEVTLAPLSTAGLKRELPANIKLVESLSLSSNSKYKKIWTIITSIRFWEKLPFLIKKINRIRNFTALDYVLSGLHISIFLDRLCKIHQFDCIYSYWSNLGPLSFFFRAR